MVEKVKAYSADVAKAIAQTQETIEHLNTVISRSVKVDGCVNGQEVLLLQQMHIKLGDILDTAKKAQELPLSFGLKVSPQTVGHSH